MIAPSPARPAIRPSPRPPIAPVRWLGRAWRELRKMRTAIILLAILALLAVVGTLLPQLPQNPRGVMGYVLRHPATAPWFARLGLFDIFSSWPFIIVAVLMYTSIGASMFIRVPAAWRRAMDRAQRNRGLWAEVASIVFHASFFILLVGVIYGKAAGVVGNAAVVEGGSLRRSDIGTAGRHGDLHAGSADREPVARARHARAARPDPAGPALPGRPAPDAATERLLAGHQQHGPPLARGAAGRRQRGHPRRVPVELHRAEGVYGLDPEQGPWDPDRAGRLRDRALRAAGQPLPAVDGARTAPRPRPRADRLSLKVTTSVTFLSSYGQSEWAQRQGRNPCPGPHPKERNAVPSCFLFQAGTGDRRNRPLATDPHAARDGQRRPRTGLLLLDRRHQRGARSRATGDVLRPGLQRQPL